jgi:hypothetical protein
MLTREIHDPSLMGDREPILDDDHRARHAPWSESLGRVSLSSSSRFPASSGLMRVSPVITCLLR